MNQTNTYPGNGNHHRPAVDVLEDSQESTPSYYDPSNPLLAPPKQTDKANQKSTKRRLIIVLFVFVVLAGCGLFLYRSLRVNRVNVTVQADARRDSQSARSKGESKSSDNNVSNEAIDLARRALGTDNTNLGNVGTPSPTPSPSLEKSNRSIPEVVPSLAVTMPARVNDNGSTNSKIGFQSGASPPSEQRSNGNTSTNEDIAQSRPNLTQTLFVDDAPPKSDRKTAQTNRTAQTPNQTRLAITPAINVAAAVLPPFGTMLPVRTQGVIFTLRNNAYARFELTSDASGKGWARGTVVIDGAGYRLMNPITDEAGRMIGGAQSKQAFVKVEAGRAAYVMVADLPKELRAVDAPGDDELTRASTSLTDREIMELILFATPAEIRAALPLMTDDQKRLALKALPAEDQKP